MLKLLNALAILFISVCLSGTAFAHASLIGSVPAPNAVLAAAPDQLVLSFSEPVSPLVMTLLAPDGSSQALADFKLIDGSVAIPAPAVMPDGTFVLSYRVVSEDGHPVAGSVIFSIGAPSVGAPTIAQDRPDWPVRIAVWLDKVALYAGLLVGVAGVFFWRCTARQLGAPRLVRSAIVVGMVAAPLAVGLQGLDLLGKPLAALVEGDVWITGLGTTLGPSALLALAAAVLAMIASFLSNARLAMAVATLAFAGIGLAFAATGHASAAQPQWLTRPAVFLHGMGVAYWTGALWPLWLLLRRDPNSAMPTLQRFSSTIPFALATLVASGVTLAIVQLGGVDSLLTTPYGRVFSVKMALVALLLALAAVNRWLLTKPAQRRETAATHKLIRALAVEMILVVAILGTVATWRFTPPPRSLTALTASSPLSVHIHTAQAMAQLTFSSSRPGPMGVDIYLMSADLGALDAKALTLELSNPGTGIEPMKYEATKGAGGGWKVDDVTIPVSGVWLINLGIRVSDFQMVRATEEAEFVQ